MADRKIFAGPRIRRIRTRLGLSQTAMAAELGISPSYLNLIERNQRPLTVQILLKLSATYDVDIGELQGDEGGETAQRLREVFSDPLLAGELPSPAEMLDAADATPNVARSLVRLYDAWRETAERLSELSGAMARGEASPATAAAPEGRTPFGEVAAFLEAADPWVPALEAAGARIAADLSPRDDMFGALKARLKALHNMDVRVLPSHALTADRARFDRHSHRIFLSESLSHSEKTRFAAIEAALVGEAALLDELAAEARLSSQEATRLVRMAYARKLAGAMLMPAERFLPAATELRHDFGRLARRFGVLPDRAMERLATARDPEAAPIEFAFISMDAAGTVETKIPGAGFLLPRYGALCSRLPLFDGLGPGSSAAATVELPDEANFVVVATASEGFAPPDGGPPPRRLAALAMTAEAAAATVYAPGPAARVRPVGPTCRLCERRACPARAMPAATRPAALNEHALGMSDYDPA